MADEHLARRRQADAAWMALEQDHAGFGLERRDLLGDGRLGVGELHRRGRQGAPVGDLREDLRRVTLSIS